MFNKKKNVLLYVLIFIMVFSIDVRKAFAWEVSANVSGLGNTKTNDCRGSNCYSLGTSGVRVWLVDDNGKKKAGPVDYWYYSTDSTKTDLSFYANTGHTIIFEEKTMRQDYLSISNNYQEIKKIIKNQEYKEKNYKKRFRPINSKLIVGFTNAYANNVYINSTKSSEDDIGNTHFNTRVPNSTETIIKRITYDAQHGNANDYIGEILNDMNARSIVKSNYYLQFEPLIQWQNLHITSTACGLTNANFIGTITEYALLEKARNNSGDFLLYSDINTGAAGDICVFNNTNSGLRTDSYGKYNGNIQIAGIGVGIKESNSVPQNLNISQISYSKFEGNNSSKYLAEVGDVKKGYGVAYISLKDYMTSICPDALPKIINHVSSDSQFLNILNRVKSNDSSLSNDYKFEWDNDKYNWLFNYKKYGFKNLNELKKYVQTKSSCEADCNYIVKNNFGRTKDLTDEVIKLFAKLNSAKSYYNYEYWTGKIIHSNTSQGINRNNPPNARLDNVDTNNLCGFKTCKQMLTLSNYKILAKFFPRASGLQDEIVELIGSPDCEYELPDCHVDNVKVSCDNASHIITFKDSKSNDSRCLPGGIAYTTEKSLVSSKEPEYGKNAYCYEEVTFDFPTTPQKTKAGTLLKWGNGLNNGNNVFGSMALSRTCYNMNTSNKVTFNWLKNINPDIRMYYVEGLSNDNVSSAYEPKKIISNNEMGIAINKMYLSYDNGFDYKWICDSRESCSKINSNNTSYTFDKKNSMVRFEFSWDIIYSNKFRWYENKDKNVNETLNEEEYNSGSSSGFNRNNYSPLGYGLPTTFVEPTGKYSHFTYDVDSKTKDGQMFVTVTNVGTMHNNKYHFNDYIKYKLSDSKDSKPGNKDKIYYSCDYNIYNELFGYEDGEECVDCSTPKGIDVVFRTVELINENANIEEQIDRAFPGKAGRGRERGSNWTVNKSTGDNYTNDDIASILSSDVYNNEPMYSISLDSALIQEIRNSNRDIRNTTAPDGTNLDPYTYMGTDEEYGYTKGLREVPDEDTDESSLKYFYISNWLTNLSRHNDRFTINNDLENMKDEYIRNYAQYNRDRVSSLLPSIFR